ncbi:hypothetical protein T03_15983, partial [Trichinella britovi]
LEWAWFQYNGLCSQCHSDGSNADWRRWIIEDTFLHCEIRGLHHEISWRVDRPKSGRIASCAGNTKDEADRYRPLEWAWFQYNGLCSQCHSDGSNADWKTHFFIVKSVVFIHLELIPKKFEQETFAIEFQQVKTWSFLPVLQKPTVLPAHVSPLPPSSHFAHRKKFPWRCPK